MDAKQQIFFEARAKILKSLAHPTRLFIVDQLSRGEHCVCELTEMVGADMSTVSKHLALLRDAGLVGVEKRRNMVFYSLRTPCVLNFLGCVESVIREQAERQQELVK